MCLFVNKIATFSLAIIFVFVNWNNSAFLYCLADWVQFQQFAKLCIYLFVKFVLM